MKPTGPIITLFASLACVSSAVVACGGDGGGGGTIPVPRADTAGVLTLRATALPLDAGGAVIDIVAPPTAAITGAQGVDPALQVTVLKAGSDTLRIFLRGTFPLGALASVRVSDVTKAYVVIPRQAAATKANRYRELDVSAFALLVGR